MLLAGASNPKISGINVQKLINVSDFRNTSWLSPNRDAFCANLAVESVVRPRKEAEHPISADVQLRAARRERETAMAEYLLIESRDPFESNEVGYYYGLARGLVEAGNKVTLLLIQNAVFAARPSAQIPQLRLLIGSGIKIFADDFSLQERGITKLLDGVQIAPIEIVVDHLEAGHRTLWH
jgi:hypothetical protein